VLHCAELISTEAYQVSMAPPKKSARAGLRPHPSASVLLPPYVKLIHWHGRIKRPDRCSGPLLLSRNRAD
jgi:hypothetical protein